MCIGDKELIQHLQTELKVAKSALGANDAMLRQYEKTIKEQGEKLEALKAFKTLASSLMENYGLQKISDFVRKSEKLSSF